MGVTLIHYNYLLATQSVVFLLVARQYPQRLPSRRSLRLTTGGPELIGRAQAAWRATALRRHRAGMSPVDQAALELRP